MPASTPLKGQSAETMARDRYECETVAKTEVRAHHSRHVTPMRTGTTPAPPTVVDREIPRQRDASFSACMTSRGYRTEGERIEP